MRTIFFTLTFLFCIRASTQNLTKNSITNFYSCAPNYLSDSLNYQNGILPINAFDTCKKNQLSDYATFVQNVIQSLFVSDKQMDDLKKASPFIKYSGFVDRSETVYADKDHISSFAFYDHELTNKNGNNLPIQKITVSGSISSYLSAMSNNGVWISQDAVYKENWLGSDHSEWAKLLAPTSLNGVSFTLFTSANVSKNNTIGAFTINTGGGKNFSFQTKDTVGEIGWASSLGIMNLKAGLIKTEADIIQSGIYKSNTAIIVSNSNELKDLTINNSIQGFFSSNKSGATGILVENLSSDPNSSARIVLKQNAFTNLIETISENSNSKLYSPGSFLIKSEGDIVLSTSSAINGNYGQLRFAVSNKEVARFTGGSLLIGTIFDVPSSALTIESDSRGVLFPRLTTEQIKNISLPQEGMIMYNKTTKKFWFYNGKNYEEICSNVISDL